LEVLRPRHDRESGSQMIVACRLGEPKESSECAACVARKGCLAGRLLAVFKSHLCLHCWQDHLFFSEQLYIYIYIYVPVCVYCCISAFIFSPFEKPPTGLKDAVDVSGAWRHC